MTTIDRLRRNPMKMPGVIQGWRRSVAGAAAGLLVALVAGGCQSRPTMSAKAPASEGMVVLQATADAPAIEAGVARAGAAVESPAAEAPAPARMRIYTAQLVILVPLVDESVARFVTLAEAEGGFLERRDGGEVTCRVPAERYRAVRDSLRAFGTVLNEAEQAQDVTRQYLDLEIRIATARASRERLLALLEKAGDTKSLVEVEKELRRLDTEIEQMEGERRYLAQQVALATITASFRAQAPSVPPSQRRGSRFPWLDRVGPEPMLEGF
jgi:hypothetical protein